MNTGMPVVLTKCMGSLEGTQILVRTVSDDYVWSDDPKFRKHMDAALIALNVVEGALRAAREHVEDQEREQD